MEQVFITCLLLGALMHLMSAFKPKPGAQNTGVINEHFRFGGRNYAQQFRKQTTLCRSLFAVPFLTLSLSLASTSFAVAQEGPDIGPRQDYREVVQALRPFIERDISANDLPAVSIAIVDDQQIVWAQGFGMARRGFEPLRFRNWKPCPDGRRLRRAVGAILSRLSRRDHYRAVASGITTSGHGGRGLSGLSVRVVALRLPGWQKYPILNLTFEQLAKGGMR
jgi:hypothetical protein